MEKANELCKDNEGVEYVWVALVSKRDDHIYCNNGAIFHKRINSYINK